MINIIEKCNQRKKDRSTVSPGCVSLEPTKDRTEKGFNVLSSLNKRAPKTRLAERNGYSIVFALHALNLDKDYGLFKQVLCERAPKTRLAEDSSHCGVLAVACFESGQEIRLCLTFWPSILDCVLMASQSDSDKYS